MNFKISYLKTEMYLKTIALCFQDSSLTRIKWTYLFTAKLHTDWPLHWTMMCLGKISSNDNWYRVENILTWYDWRNKHPTIFDIIHWVAGSLGCLVEGTIVSLPKHLMFSKCYFFLISRKIHCKNHFFITLQKWK